MWFTFLLSIISVIGYGHASSKCVDIMVPVTVTAQSLTVAFPPFKDSYQATAFIQEVLTRDASETPFSDAKNITDSFSISAHYCVPSVQETSKTLQILTHGLSSDKSYWDFTRVAGNYSFIQAALAAGYSTFSYDRLGNGQSTKADPYNIVQAPTELAILIELTKKLRFGHIDGCDVHEKVVHVGHSYGSELTNSLVAAEPTLSDGIIPTGFSNNFTFQVPFLSTTGHLASENQPARLGALASGYLTWADKYNNQFNFMQYPYFDPLVLTVVEANKWAFTIGEVLTQTVLDYAAVKFTGPVLFLAAQYDHIFCGGDCSGIIDGPYSISRRLFPAVSDFEVYIQPNVGHAINLHYNSSGAYAVANDFFKGNGL